MTTRVPRGPLEFTANRLRNMTSFPPLASNDALLDRPSSVAATRNRVKNFFEIHFSLRRRGKQRLALAHVPRRTDRPIERERAPQLLVGFGATSLVDKLLGGTQPEERLVRDHAHVADDVRGSEKVARRDGESGTQPGRLPRLALDHLDEAGRTPERHRDPRVQGQLDHREAQARELTEA